MKKFRMFQEGKNGKICGYDNDASLVINRNVFSTLPEWQTMHSHPKGDEYYLFLHGKGEITINDKIIPFEAGDVILCEAGETHKVTKIIEEIELIVIRTNPNKNDRIDFD